jgi:polygalacturonase
MTRRGFIASVACAGHALRAADSSSTSEEAIRSRIRAPNFAQRDFDITRYGGRGDGHAKSTEAVKLAIDACSQAGGGRVVVPSGVFLAGPIHLRSGVDLHLSAGATLRFSRDPRDYLPVVFTRWEGTECMNYSPFIYALEQRNIAITGGGVLDGQADCEHWWAWSGKNRCGGKPGDPGQQNARETLHKMAENGIPVSQRVFGEGHYLRPQFIQPYRCTNVLIEGVTILNSPMWEIHPVLCRNVTVRDVHINSHGPNNDGCDPESCSDVLIEGCTFDTGDDCIAIKSGRNADGRRLHAPCENLIIADCTMQDGHGGVSIGSEISGDVRNVFVRDCKMSSPHLERALRIKTNSYRGGIIENVSFRKVTVGEVSGDVIQIDFSYEEGEGGPFQPVVRNVEIADVTCKKSGHGLNLRGYESAPIRDVRIRHCNFDNVEKGNLIQNVVGLKLDDLIVNGKRA